MPKIKIRPKDILPQFAIRSDFSNEPPIVLDWENQHEVKELLLGRLDLVLKRHRAKYFTEIDFVDLFDRLVQVGSYSHGRQSIFAELLERERVAFVSSVLGGLYQLQNSRA